MTDSPIHKKTPAVYLVTGAAGFIGARFVESCATHGIDVISVDSSAFFDNRPEHSKIDFGRVVDRDELFSERKLPEFDAIVHLGACADTTELNEEYLRRVNVDYSKQLWKLAIERKIPMIYASSAATYGAQTAGASCDDESQMESLKPLNPYGHSKLQFDLWALEEEKSGKSPPLWAGFKFFNVYGFGERHKLKMASVVLHAFDQIQKNGAVTLFKSHKAGVPDGEQMRDFIYVDDVIRVLHFALDRPIQRGIYNLGSGRARSFKDLVSAVFSALKLPLQIHYVDTPAEIRDRYQYFTQARMDRLREQGYSEPFTSLESGVSQYVQALLKPCK